jgi:hypothetical protein
LMTETFKDDVSMLMSLSRRNPRPY